RCPAYLSTRLTISHRTNLAPNITRAKRHAQAAERRNAGPPTGDIVVPDHSNPPSRRISRMRLAPLACPPLADRGTAQRAKHGVQAELAVRSFDELAPPSRRAEIVHLDPGNVIGVARRQRAPESRAEGDLVGACDIGENVLVHVSVRC